MRRKTSSNTGAQTPTRETKPLRGIDHATIDEKEQVVSELFGLIDYISCTFPYETTEEINDLIVFLGGDWFKTSDRSKGYNTGLRCGGMSLWSQGRLDMGVNLQVTGAGCRELEMRTISQGWHIFIGELLKRGAKFTRLDIALDDRAGILSFDEIKHCCYAGLVVSRFKTFEPKQHVDAATGHLITSGFIFGSRKSNTMLRIYDKALEQGVTGQEVEKRPHIRVELEAKGSKARALSSKLAEEGERIIAGVIADTVDFKHRGNDSHRERWKTQKWWTGFLRETEKVRLSTAPSHRSLEKSMDALEYQYGMTMAMVVRTYGEPRLLEMARNGEERLKRKEFRIAGMDDPYKKAC